MNERGLRAFAAWPGVEAGMKWEDDLVFTVAGRMSCATCLRGPHKGSISLKVEEGRFLGLTGRRGFIPTPYLARARWVQLPVPTAIAREELRQLIRRSCELVRAKLPARTRQALADRGLPVAVLVFRGFYRTPQQGILHGWRR